MVYDGDELDLVCCFVSYYFIVKKYWGNGSDLESGWLWVDVIYIWWF